MIDRKQENTAVLVVDVQGDFTQLMNGSLAVEGTGQAYLDQVTAETRRLKSLGFKAFATQDWHPADHISFVTRHEGHNPFDIIDLHGRDQILWPPHCVQNTPNAKVLVDNRLFDAIVKKGMDPRYDSYSGFFDDGGHDTGLDALLKTHGITDLIMFGLTTDYCARATALDARSLGYGVMLR
ncbi:MAG: isochorismatase family protein, partial [Desulfobacteraceae bacterium]|nr:isochorismatase family protein [Desulfobacteraceae bacterium]